MWIENQLQMLQDMGLNRNACTGYLALTEAAQHYPGHPSNIAAINADLSRLKAPNGLHHYVQSSKRRRHSTDTMDKVNGENAIEIDLCVPLCVRHESPTTIAMAGHCRPFFSFFLQHQILNVFFFWNAEMHNLSISCAVVCVILLGAAAILGTFGIVRRELSAVLITGVMYILAGIRTHRQEIVEIALNSIYCIC